MFSQKAWVSSSHQTWVLCPPASLGIEHQRFQELFPCLKCPDPLMSHLSFRTSGNMTLPKMPWSSLPSFYMLEHLWSSYCLLLAAFHACLILGLPILATHSQMLLRASWYLLFGTIILSLTFKHDCAIIQCSADKSMDLFAA